MFNARNLTAEFLGTFALVFFGAGSIVVNTATGGSLGLLGIALANATVLSVMVTAAMNISGAHFNPAVTVALWLANKIDPKSAGGYVVAQLVGAAAAAYLLIALLPASAVANSGLGNPQLGEGIDFLRGVLIEAVLTFFLVSAIFGTVVSPNAPAVGGFGIGLTMVFAILVGGPLTGAALNPARAFGPALASMNWLGHAVYWIGPLLGAAVASFVWSKVLLPKTP